VEEEWYRIETRNHKWNCG